MLKNRIAKLLLLFVLFMTIMTNNVAIVSASGIGSIEEFEELDGDAKYLGESYYDNYYLDIEKTGLLDGGDKALNNFANVLFSVIKTVGKLTCSLYYFVMDFDIADIFGGKINEVQEAMRNSIFSPLFNIAFACTTFVMIRRLIKRDTAAIFAEIGKVLAIVAFSVSIVNKSDVALSNTTQITKGIATDILTNMNDTYGVKGGANYAASSAGVLWVSLVHEPWIALEFGSSKPNEETINNFLTTVPGSDERGDLVKNYDNEEVFAKTKGVSRCGLILVYIVPFVAKCVIYIIVAALQMVFQLLALIFVMLAPLVLILAMVPEYETVISSWLKKILETQISILVITFVMALMIKLDTTFYELIPKYGWLVGIMLQTLFSVALFLGRNKILAVFAGIQQGMGNPRYLQMQMRHAGNPYKQIQQMQNSVRQRQMIGNQKKSRKIDIVESGTPKSEKSQGSTKESKVQKIRPVTLEKQPIKTQSNSVKHSDLQLNRTRQNRPKQSYIQQEYCATQTQYNQIDTSDLNSIWENAVQKDQVKKENVSSTSHGSNKVPNEKNSTAKQEVSKAQVIKSQRPVSYDVKLDKVQNEKRSERNRPISNSSTINNSNFNQAKSTVDTQVIDTKNVSECKMEEKSETRPISFSGSKYESGEEHLPSVGTKEKVGLTSSEEKTRPSSNRVKVKSSSNQVKASNIGKEEKTSNAKQINTSYTLKEQDVQRSVVLNGKPIEKTRPVTKEKNEKNISKGKRAEKKSNGMVSKKPVKYEKQFKVKV